MVGDTMICALIIAGIMPGGSIPAHAALADALTAARCEVRIEGQCISACTMLLDVPGACVSSGAMLMFHGPQFDYGMTQMPRAEFDHWSQVLADHYPRRIARWYLAEGRNGQHWMTGREAIRLGARRCE